MFPMLSQTQHFGYKPLETGGLYNVMYCNYPICIRCLSSALNHYFVSQFAPPSVLLSLLMKPGQVFSTVLYALIRTRTDCLGRYNEDAAVKW